MKNFITEKAPSKTYYRRKLKKKTTCSKQDTKREVHFEITFVSNINLAILFLKI